MKVKPLDGFRVSVGDVKVYKNNILGLYGKPRKNATIFITDRLSPLIYKRKILCVAAEK